LFNEAEKEAEPELAEPTVETITYKCRKQRGRREAMLKDLPVETIEYRLPPEEQVCPNCSGPLHEMSTEVGQEPKVIPAQVKIVKHVRYIYSCRRCEREDTSTPVVTAKAPAPVIPGSLASPSAVAYIMNNKYVDGLPLYRQCRFSPKTDPGFSLKTDPPLLGNSLRFGNWFRFKSEVDRRMITVEKWTVVRYLHAQGLSQRAIAKKLGISRNTVRRALETDEPPKYVRASEAISKKLQPFVDDIKEMFLEKKLIGSRIFREIRGRGYQGSQSTLYQYLSQLKKKNLAEKACVRFETKPGQQGQFDWSEYKVPIDTSLTRIFLFDLTLSYSRRKFLFVIGI